MESIRCGDCRALLLKADTVALRGRIQIKCRRCGAINHVRASGSGTERPCAPEEAMPRGKETAPSSARSGPLRPAGK